MAKFHAHLNDGSLWLIEKEFQTFEEIRGWIAEHTWTNAFGPLFKEGWERHPKMIRSADIVVLAQVDEKSGDDR